MAAKDACYRFSNQTGDMDGIANVEDATTTITMNGDYSVTAEFVKPKQSLEITMWGLP